MEKRLNVLVTALGCSPVKGSEYGSAWGWVNAIANRGHTVHVITREVEKDDITRYLINNQNCSGLNFYFVDALPNYEIKEGRFKFLAYLYIFLWQLMAVARSHTICRDKSIDLVHHLSYGGIRLPSFLWILGKPLIVGPLGGGERAPWRLRKSYPMSGWIKDLIRDLSNWWVSYDPLVQISFRKAFLILLRTKDNERLVSKVDRKKIRIVLNNSIKCEDFFPREFRGDQFNVLMAGRFLYWKGMHLGLQAFARAAADDARYSLTIVGQGPEEIMLRKLSQELGVSSKINWIEWVTRREMRELLSRHDLVLFPSLHDSGGNVILEGASVGTPTVCLDLGGPGAMVSDDRGIKVPVDDIAEPEIADELACALRKLADDPNLMRSLSLGARRWAETCNADQIVSNVYTEVEEFLFQQKTNLNL